MRLGDSRLNLSLGRCSGLGIVVALVAGRALAVDTPPNPSLYFPNFGKADLAKAPPIDAAPTLVPEANRLMARYPGVRFTSWRGNVLGFYGTPMTRGDTPAQAASDFVMQHGRAFGAGTLELKPTWNGAMLDARHHVFHYDQTMDGLPVEFGRFTVLVRTTPDNLASGLHNRVVMAQGRLATRPEGGFQPDLVWGETAVAIAKDLDGYKDLTSWSEPSQVVYFGEGDLETWITPIRAWKVTGEIPGQPRKYSFFVNCATGEVVFIRGEVQFADATGTVQANVTPGSGSDHAGNPPALRPLDDIDVESGATSTLTDVAGAYTLGLAGAGPVDVSTSLASGQWVEVFSPQEPTTPILSETQSTLLPGTANFVLNAVPTEFATAQANAFYYQTLTHNYIRGRTPVEWTSIDFALDANVNLVDSGGITSCNAFYNGVSTNFFINTGGCNNTAGGSVTSHEYGHHIVNRLGLAQGAFGEGFSDTMSMMIFNDAIIGRNFTTGGGVIRTPDSANIQYPCNGTANHYCGQIVGGAVWEIRKAYVNFYGATNGLELVRQQHADWAMITDGGQGVNSAHPQTAIEWLTIDDDDGDIDDGSPNYTRLTSAFGAHSITLPARVAVDFDFPDGLPENVLPGTAAEISVRVEGVTVALNQSTAKVFYREGETGAFSEALLQPVAGEDYTAVIPTTTCGAVQYYFSVQTTTGTTYTSPAGAPGTFYTTQAVAYDEILSESFETATAGWTTSQVASGTAAVTGQWVRGNPVGTTAQPEDDHTGGSNVNCWFTGQGTVGAAVGAADVDGGKVILTSPAYDLSDGAGWQLVYWLWYNNRAGATPNQDVFTTEVSVDNGSTWALADSVGPDTTAFIGWNQRVVDLAAIPGVLGASQVRVRFIADDAEPGSVVEAAIDDMAIRRTVCSLCPADLDDGSGLGNTDGGVDINDLLFFLTKFELGDVSVDLDNDGDPAQSTPDGGVDINDLLFFLLRFESGC